MEVLIYSILPKASCVAWHQNTINLMMRLDGMVIECTRFSVKKALNLPIYD